MGKFILQQMNIDPQELAKEKPLQVDMQLVDKVFDDLVKVLEKGMSNGI